MSLKIETAMSNGWWIKLSDIYGIGHARIPICYSTDLPGTYEMKNYRNKENNIHLITGRMKIPLREENCMIDFQRIFYFYWLL